MPSQIMPSEPDLRSNRADEIAALEADARLREEIRLLGRILGDTVRDQEGVDVFDLVERIRQMRAQNSAGNVGTLARTLAHAREAGISADQLRRFFGTAQVSPVLTAHPTEVRRKSTIDREMEIAALLDRRERMHLTAEEFEASEEQLRRAVLTLWQTNLLRRTKLTVLDEVANGLSFYDYTFLHEVPQLHCAPGSPGAFSACSRSSSAQCSRGTSCRNV